MRNLFLASIAACALFPVQTLAQEVFGGFYAHAVDTPLTFDTGETGSSDIAFGVRFDGIAALGFLGEPEPYVLASINTQGDTSFAGIGVAWTIGDGRFYVRPGIGIIVHDAPELRFSPETGLRTDLGSRVLFEPEIGVGYRLSERVSVEASWIHISQGRVFDALQNPGIDMIGVRVNVEL